MENHAVYILNFHAAAKEREREEEEKSREKKYNPRFMRIMKPPTFTRKMKIHPLENDFPDLKISQFVPKG